MEESCACRCIYGGGFGRMAAVLVDSRQSLVAGRQGLSLAALRRRLR